jgi:tRNA threonylcarbamoyladenosine biosynthesis protein TsaE
MSIQGAPPGAHPGPDFSLLSRSADETRAAGRALGDALRRIRPAGAVIALSGPLGAGKTCFVGGLARGLGVSGYVRSPTFMLVHEYDGPVPLFHVDLYRLSAGDLSGIGLDEILEGPGVTVIEWGDRAAGTLPAEVLWIDFAFGTDESERLLVFRATGAGYHQIIRDLEACVSSR